MVSITQWLISFCFVIMLLVIRWSRHLEFPLHVINATSVNTFISLYIKWKRFKNGHWIMSITTANLGVYFVLIYVMPYFMSFLWLELFGTDVLVSVYYCLLWTVITLVPFIYTCSLLTTKLYWLFILWSFTSWLIKDWVTIS